MSICAQCNAQVRDDARFCQRCGTPIVTPELATAGAPQARAVSPAKKPSFKRIGPYHVIRMLRPDDNVYVVESDVRVTGAAHKPLVAIEAPRSFPKKWIEQVSKLSRLKNIAKFVNQVRDERRVNFFIVELMPGDPLDLASHPMLPTRVINIGLQMGAVADFVHKHDLTFNQNALAAGPKDSLTRFERAFLLSERDTLIFFDPSFLAPMPKDLKKKKMQMRDDTILIIRTLLPLFTGKTIGRAMGTLVMPLIPELIKNPPSTATNLVGELSQMLPAQPSPQTTVPLSKLSPKPGVTQPIPQTLQLVPFAKTDVGIERDHNEDNYLVLPMNASEGLFLVADGMGGHAAGEVASRLVVEEMRASAISEWSQLAVSPTHDSVRGRLTQWIKRANEKIISAAQAQGNNMGSTMTAALILNRQVYAANVGDSRTILFRNGELYPLTWDHSLVASLVRAHLLEPDAVYDHPQRNEIFRSLGQQNQVKADVFEPVDLASGDRVLLCSDGLWEMVRPAQLKDILTRWADPTACCSELIRAANEKGGEDNITAAIVWIT